MQILPCSSPKVTRDAQVSARILDFDDRYHAEDAIATATRCGLALLDLIDGEAAR